MLSAFPFLLLVHSASVFTMNFSIELTDQITDVEHINSGFFGSVFRAVRVRDGQEVAVKVLNFSAGALQEARLSKKLSHPNIINTYSYAPLRDGSIALVQEYANGGDLYDFLSDGGFQDEASLKTAFYQIGSALQYLHSRNIVHRDIKPENCVLKATDDDDDVPFQVKLIDFGLAEEGRFCTTHVGTDSYNAPEVLSLPGVHELTNMKIPMCDDLDTIDGFAADVFSLGVTLYTIICKELPWCTADASIDEDYRAFLERHDNQIPGAAFSMDPEAMGILSALCDLLDAMLHPDPSMRPAIGQVLERLDQPWFNAPVFFSSTSSAASDVTSTSTSTTTTTVSTMIEATYSSTANTAWPLFVNVEQGTERQDSGVSTCSSSCSSPTSIDSFSSCVSSPSPSMKQHFLWSDDIDECCDLDEALDGGLPPIPSFLMASA